MKNPIKLTIEDIAVLVSQCKDLGVGCDIRLIPIDTKKDEEKDGTEDDSR